VSLAEKDGRNVRSIEEMIQLSIAGLSRDGARLLLVSDDGTEFILTVDDTLRAAARGDHARIGQLEIQMESALRPRDIQARIRAGETPDQVARAAQTTVEAIMPYAGPVLAERAHIADRAQRASLRRSGEPSGQGSRTLGDGVAGHLQPQHIDPDTVAWDAWRREDGRWMLTAEYAVGAQAGVARFAFDAPGNYVTVENDEARWLVGEHQTQTTADEPVAELALDDLDVARQRRLTALVADELPLGEDALELVSDSADSAVAQDQEIDPEDSTIDLSETADRIRAAEGEPSRREVSKTRGRASVPSWDEIMFGGKTD
jgi:Protein of unknown function (DUF3071)